MPVSVQYNPETGQIDHWVTFPAGKEAPPVQEGLERLLDPVLPTGKELGDLLKVVNGEIVVDVQAEEMLRKRVAAKQIIPALAAERLEQLRADGAIAASGKDWDALDVFDKALAFVNENPETAKAMTTAKG